MTNNKEKLKKILAGISYSESKSEVKETIKTVEKEMMKVADKIREDAEVKTVERMRQVAETKDQIQSVFDSLVNLKQGLKQSENDLDNALNQKIDALKNAMAEYKNAGLERLKTLSTEIDQLKIDINEISQTKVGIPSYKNQIGEVENKLGKLITALKEETGEKIEGILTDSKKKVSGLEGEIKRLRGDAMSAIASRGGATPFQVNANSSVISTRYADINFQQFGNVGWTAVNDDDNKRVNIRASILVGGGGGTTRTVSVLSVSSTLAAAATTDYTFFANVGINLTLPTAIGNTNRYSIKNMAASSVLVSAAVGQNIDDATTALLSQQYEAIDVMSNGSVFGIY